jgi:histidinol-phosphate phosphatase family protein
MTGKAAIFFDIDGVLNHEPGENGVVRPEDIHLVAGAGKAIAAAKQAGFLAVGVTNRAQVAKGYITLPQLDAIFARLQGLLAADGAALDKIYFCPHHPKGVVPEFTLRCECRKPGSLLYRRAIAEQGIDPKKSFVIGDSLRDIGGARAVGVTAFGVRTGYGCRDADRYEGSPPIPAPDRMFDDVGAAVAFILRPQPAKRILYVVSEDWYFLSHRLPMARAARDAGFEVHVATNVRAGGEAIAREGFVLHAVPFSRGKIAPGGIAATVRALRHVHRRIQPALVHRVALQPTVLDALAAIGSPAPSINAITGLGNSFIAGSPRARVLRALIGFVLRYLINGRSGVALVQNHDDESLMRSFGFPAERIALIPGSGVDTHALAPQPEPAGSPTVGFVGRLLADKGIHTLIEAHRLLRKELPDARLLVAGTPDPANAASISPSELAQWRDEPGIAFLGHVTDIPAFWARTHIATLPSRREGLPKSLLEAAACERAMVATDVPGCRAAVTAGETGLLVPPDDAQALAAALKKLLSDRQMRQRMARAARRTAETRFSAEAVGRATVDLYRRLADNT